jgi:general secretion pathway protein A
MSSTLLIYAEHFGLRDRAFSLLPDPEYLYWSPVHARAYAVLEYGLLTHAPITLVTGEIGIGKTTLVRHLLRNVPEDFVVGLISNSQGNREQLLHWILLALDQTADSNSSYVQLFNQFQNFLVSTYAAGRRTVLIFDEAQNLPIETLEVLRMLSNINADKDELLQMILIGQPQLREKINRPELEQFSQRIASDFHLPAMTAEGVDEYIQYRLTVAGAQREIFTPEARRSVFLHSRGIPRLINRVCETALVYAFSDNLAVVDAAMIAKVAADWKDIGQPVLVSDESHKTRLTRQNANTRIASLAGNGLSPKDIRKYFHDHYEDEIAEGQIATVMSGLNSSIKSWLARPLRHSYSVICFDHILVKVRDNGRVLTKPVYTVLAVDALGIGHVLSVLVSQIIGSKTYAALMNDIVSRGVQHVAIAMIEGADGYFEAARKAFPEAKFLRSVHGPIQRMLDMLPSDVGQQLMADMIEACQADSKALGQMRFDDIGAKLEGRNPKIVDHWRRAVSAIDALRGKGALNLEIVRAAYTLRPFYRDLRSVANVRSPYSSDEAVVRRAYAALRKSKGAA